jgi:hypothetical protein
MTARAAHSFRAQSVSAQPEWAETDCPQEDP